MSGDAQPLEVWRGAVTPRRCDEMGHMNMRYYLAVAEEGLATLASALGQPRAFARGAGSTLRACGWHVRFLREARSGEALYATAGLLEMGEADARALFVVRHADGRPAATLVAQVDHATPDGRAFAWSARARAAADALMCALPADAGPRGVPPPDPEPLSVVRADRAGLRPIARGAVTVEECDASGQMTAAAIFGRVADGTTALFGPHWPVLEQAHPDRRIGSAALEYALTLRRTPRLGELIAVRSGFARIEAKTLHPRHWLLDPAGGEAYGSLVGVGAALDLDARRILSIPASLRQGQIPGLP